MSDSSNSSAMASLSASSYDGGAANQLGWICLMVLLIPTLFLNVATLILLLSAKHLHRSSAALMMRYLSVEDIALSLSCLIQCLVNFNQERLVGGQLGCMIQSLYTTFLMLSGGYTLCLIALNSERKITKRATGSPRRVFIMHLMSWVLAFFVAILSSAILAPPRMMPSGYCFPSLQQDLGAALLFYVCGIVFVGVFLSHRYYCIFVHVSACQQKAVMRAQSSEARSSSSPRVSRITRRLILLVGAYFACTSPILLVSLWEFIFKVSLSPYLHIFVIVMIHANSLLNPILYCYYSSSLRTAFFEIFTGIFDSTNKLSTSSGELDRTSVESFFQHKNHDLPVNITLPLHSSLKKLECQGEVTNLTSQQPEVADVWTIQEGTIPCEDNVEPKQLSPTRLRLASTIPMSFSPRRRDSAERQSSFNRASESSRAFGVRRLELPAPSVSSPLTHTHTLRAHGTSSSRSRSISPHWSEYESMIHQQQSPCASRARSPRTPLSVLNRSLDRSVDAGRKSRSVDVSLSRRESHHGITKLNQSLSKHLSSSASMSPTVEELRSTLLKNLIIRHRCSQEIVMENFPSLSPTSTPKTVSPLSTMSNVQEEVVPSPSIPSEVEADHGDAFAQ